jgi:hypothetical protein
MSFHRIVVAAFAALAAASLSSAAFAGCGGCGFATPAPYIYAQPAPVYAPVPQLYAEPAPVYALPPAAYALPMPVAPAPLAVDHWDTGGFGGCGGCGRAFGYAPPVAPAPLYVVNQGPQYSGPGIVVPYRTYSPAAAYVPAVNYPYIGQRYGYRGPGYYPFYRGPRYAYHARVFVHPHYFYHRRYLYR